MSRRLIWALTGLLILPSWPLSAAGPADDKLAGEDDKAVPTAVPTPMGDERALVSATRTTQAASSFDLPAFVITGGGERKALAQREGFGISLDTSGGIKTSPGEKGAGKDQLEAQGGRERLQDVSATSRSFVGALRLDAGWQPGYGASGYLGQELGRAFWLLDADAGSSEGGPLRGPMRDPALSDQAKGRLRAGWRFDQGRVLGVDADAGYAAGTPEPYVSGASGTLRRQRLGGGADFEGGVLGADLRSRVEGGSARADLWGTDLVEDRASAELALSRRLNGRTGSALLEAAFKAETLSQALGGQRRSLLLLRGSFTSRFEAFPGNRLGLGLSVDNASGDSSALLLGPRLRLEQRLAPAWAFRASFDSRLSASRLDGEDFQQVWHLPDPRLPLRREDVDASADLYWRPRSGFSMQAGAFVRQGGDWFLPHSVPGSPLAVDTAVRGFRLTGGRLLQRWHRGAWSEALEGTLQQAQLTDLPAEMATYIPGWTAKLSGGWAQGRYKLRAGVDALGPRQAAADGSLPLDASFDLWASAEAALNESWSLFAEGRNLAAQTVEDAPFYPHSAPWLGLGAELRF